MKERSDRFSNNLYAPKDEWTEVFGTDARFVRSFLTKNRQYLLGRRKETASPSLPRFQLWDTSDISERRLVSEFDSPEELVAILKVMS
jgi:hypothetical protein